MLYEYMYFNNLRGMLVQAALSKFGLPCAFRGKLIYIHFLQEKYILFKKKDVSIFLSSYHHCDVTK